MNEIGNTIWRVVLGVSTGIGVFILIAVLAAGIVHINDCVEADEVPGVVIQVPFREDGVMCYVDRDSGSMSCLPYYFEPEETNNEQP